MITVRFETGDCLELPIESFVGADLKGINFHRAIFEYLDFSRADFTGCNLRNSVFYCSVLNCVKMKNVSLVNAILTGSKMRGGDLSESLLMYSDFSKVDLSLVNLRNSNVAGADFRGADFSGADFSGLGLDQCKLEGAFYDSATVWPKNFNPDEYGLLKKKNFTDPQLQSSECRDGQAKKKGAKEVAGPNATGGTKVGPGTDLTPELKEHSDGSYRTPDGKFASPTGLAPPGTVKADEFAKHLESNGMEVVGTEMVVKGPLGDRRYDIVVRDASGKLHGLEVKSGTANKTSYQEFTDYFVNEFGAQGKGRLKGEFIESTTTVYVP